MNKFKGLERPRFKYSFIYWLVIISSSRLSVTWAPVSAMGETQEREWKGTRGKGLEVRSWGSDMNRVHFAVVPRTSLRRKTYFCSAKSKGAK